MITYIKGIIIHKNSDSAVAETGGIGYEIGLSEDILHKVHIGEIREFFIYQQITDHGVNLYGLESWEDLAFFKMLLTVSGIGPKLASSIISRGRSRVEEAIASHNIEFLSTIPRLGKKSAERLIVELKNKIHTLGNNALPSGQDELVEALLTLGYPRHHIQNFLSRAQFPSETLEDKVKYALQFLGK